MSPTEKRRITAEDLYTLQLITGSEISPDGKTIVYALQKVDRKTEKKYSNLWLLSTDSGETRQITFGDQVDDGPRWNPDGSAIAFLSNRKEEEQFQLYLLPMEGGEAAPITDLKGEFGSFAWSPDSSKLVFEFRKKDEEALQREQDEQKKKLGITARHIERVFYKLDGYGYLPKERWHLWRVEVSTLKTHQITDSTLYDELEPAWSPDGQQVVFCSNHSADPDLDYEAIDLFITDSAGENVRKVETSEGGKQTPSFSPDGEWIAYVGQDGKGCDWKNQNVWKVRVDGSSPAVNLTQQYDVNAAGWTINDHSRSHSLTPVWSRDGEEIFFTVARHGSTDLVAISAEGSHYEEIFAHKGVVLDFSFDRSHSHIAIEHQNAFTPGQILLVSLEPKVSERELLNVNRNLLDGIDLGTLEEIWFKGADDNDLQGWILKPPAFDENQTYPAILEIHGGPLVQYGDIFMHEFYYLAAQGYVVFYCNPRGGQGYGEEHAKAIHGAWGTADYQDLMVWSDLVAQKPYVDANRLGVTGGSYGGYMTNWIIGHTQRFKAAVTQRSVSNLTSMWGSSDFNWSFQDTFGNLAPYESIENLWECSPMKHIGAARTPTLVIHSEQDLRCPIEQGEQVFVALKKLGVDTEFVIFPDEPHGLSRGGRTDRRIERLNSIRGWFDRYLK